MDAQVKQSLDAKVIEPTDTKGHTDAKDVKATIEGAVDKTVIEEINSSTHRAEHARLTRRMASIDVAKYPQMARLWAGSRKE